ncbi:MAG: hypothetical protein V3T77_07450 [Planctomycetota bacterium]
MFWNDWMGRLGRPVLGARGVLTLWVGLTVIACLMMARSSPLLSQESEAAKPTDTAPARPKEKVPGTAQELLARVVEAAGGADQLATMKNLSWISKQVRDPYGEQRKLHVRALVIFPDKMRIDYTEPGRRWASVINGDEAWLSERGTYSDWSAEEVADFQKAFRLATTQLLIHHKELKVEELDPVEYKGKRYRLLRVQRLNLASVDLHIDPDTYQVFHRRMTLPTTRGIVKREEIRKDYREVEGLMLPFTRVVYENGKETTRISVMKYWINGPVKPDSFERPGVPKEKQ